MVYTLTARSNYPLENKLEELEMHLNISIHVCHSQVVHDSLTHIKNRIPLQSFPHKGNCVHLSDLQSPYLLRC